ncbi:acyltransferase family protein [Nostoc sp. C117]|uniref:acyltransferase family protein n=1 Tax=Nostoc sp. C117 TaxID=3349875 RepID=UPI00370D9898
MTNCVINKSINPIHSLTSLRFFSAIAIVFFHIKSTMPIFFSGSYLENLKVGVEFFFVLSGFILGYNYNQSAKLSLKEFYIKRFARIYPLHLLTFIIWCFLFFSSWGNETQEKLVSGFANITLTQAFFPGLLFSLGYNAVSWSLSNEVFFYTLFPLIRRVKFSIIIVFIVITYLLLLHLFNLQEIVNNYFPNFNHFSPFVRISDFCCGIITAQFYQQNTRLKYANFLEVFMISLVIFQVNTVVIPISPDFMQIYYSLIFSLLILIFAHEQGAISKYIANQKFLIFLGEASFSLYMWHHIVLHYCGENFSPQTPKLLAISSAVLISILISMISFKYFELVSRKFILEKLLNKS